MKKFAKCLCFYTLLIFLLEIIYKVLVLNIYLSIETIYTLLFSIIYAIFFTMITVFLSKKVSFVIKLILIIFTTFLFIAEAMFAYIFDTTFSIHSLNLANQAFDFRRILYQALLEKWYMIILFLIPLIIFILFHKKIYYRENYKNLYKHIIIYILSNILVFIVLLFNKNAPYSAYNLYFNTHAPTLTVSKLGLITEFKLDVSRFVFGFNPKIDYIEPDNKEEKDETEIKAEYNKLDLSFENSQNDTLNNYFLAKKPTNKNKYTGIFKDKNIIYILAEGFNSIAVDKNITPTLYKMVNSSFVFKNYYSPMFMSTTGGEFLFSTSLIPTQESLNKWKNGKTIFPYAIGNAFKDMGYETFAYHNWTHSYYKRQVTMPTLGFDNYKACGNGLEKKMNCKIWPPSDIELMKASIDDYINKEKFAVHYITVSGHSEYNFYGNNMALKNKALVNSLGYSTAVKAYLATQIELDKALELLIGRLEEVNKLNDTVIVLSGDHYPYTLNLDQINEISTYKRDSIFEINNSNLIIYNPTQKITKIDKLSSSVDVLPTILNMFGYEYDSRILIGSDIMSEHESIVIFSDYSWITEKGKYSATSNIFTKNDGVEIEENYIAKINREVQNRVNVSTQIVENNYYSKILPSRSSKS